MKGAHALARNLEPVLTELLREEPIIAVRGARTSGKTTALKRLTAVRSGTVLDLDLADVLRSAVDDPDHFVTGLPEPVFIDEFQRAPALLHALKAQTDRDRRPGRYILSGSVSADALPRDAETLTGRAHSVVMWPFSQGELRGVRETFIDRLFQEPKSLVMRRGGKAPPTRDDYFGMVCAGGFPLALQRETERSRQRWFADYADTVARRDIPNLTSIRNPDALAKLVNIIAGRTATLLNVADVARDVGLRHETTSGYLSWLERVYVIVRLKAWSTNLSKKQSKHPKVHMTDTGLGAHLIGLGPAEASRSNSAGQLLETFVVTEVMKQLSWAETSATAWHWRDREMDEVDLLLESRNGRIVAIEIKAGTNVTENDTRGIRRLQEILGDRVIHGVVIYTGSVSYSIGRNISVVPVSALWN